MRFSHTCCTLRRLNSQKQLNKIIIDVLFSRLFCSLATPFYSVLDRFRPVVLWYTIAGMFRRSVNFTRCPRLGVNMAKGVSDDSVKKVPSRKGEYIYGAAPCLASLLAKRRKIHKILLKRDILVKDISLKKLTMDKISAHVHQYDTKLYYVEKEKLDRISGKNTHQGIAMDVEPLEFKTLHQAQLEITKEQHNTLPVRLLLDDIHDPMNFGAILRSAYYLGVDKIITGRNNCQLSPVVSKASAGVMELMPVYSVTNIITFLQESSAHGWDLIGTSDPKVFKHSPIPVYSCMEFPLMKPSVLIIGNEGSGLSEGVKRQCTAMLSIPPCRDLPIMFNSLNAAVATGIILYSIQANKYRT